MGLSLTIGTRHPIYGLKTDVKRRYLTLAPHQIREKEKRGNFPNALDVS